VSNESSDQNKSIVLGSESQGRDPLGVLIGFRSFDSGPAATPTYLFIPQLISGLHY
jgi:hypothetical protein